VHAALVFLELELILHAVVFVVKRTKYPPRQKTKDLAKAAMAQVQQLFNELLDEKLVPTDEVVMHLARLARITESPKFGLWVKEQIDAHKIEVSMPTLQTLLHSFGVKKQYKEPANEVLKRLVAMDKLEQKRRRGDLQGFQSDDNGEDSERKNLAEGAFVDPEVEEKEEEEEKEEKEEKKEETFDFTRVQSRRRMF